MASRLPGLRRRACDPAVGVRAAWRRSGHETGRPRITGSELSECGGGRVARGMKDGRERTGGPEVRIDGRPRERPRTGERGGEGGECPPPAVVRRGAGRRRRRGRAPRTERPRARGWPSRRFVGGRGKGPGRAKKFQASRVGSRPGSGDDVVRRTPGLGRGGQDVPQRQERQERSEPGTRREAASRGSHPTPQNRTGAPPTGGFIDGEDG
jgi:hypothetical protein